MNPTATRRLIRRMLDSRTLMPETVEELKDYLKDLERGTLDPADDAYIHQLAQRLGFDRGRSKADAPEPDEEEQPEEEPEEEAGEESFEEPEEDVYEPEEADIPAAVTTPDDRVEALRAALARARAALDTLHDPDAGINLDLAPDQAAELLVEIRRALDDAETELD